MRVAAFALSTLFLGWSELAAAQLPFDKVFERVTDLGMFVTVGGFVPRSRQLETERNVLVGAGIEVLFEVGGLGKQRGKNENTSPTTDSTLVEVVVTTKPVPGQATQDTIAVVKKYSVTVTKPESDPKFLIELALGYSQQTYFRSRQDAVDLRGSLQELPSVVLYVTDQRGDWITWYWMLKSGLIQLHSIRAYTSGDSVYTAAASAVQVGLGVGLLFAKERALGFFTELDWIYRRFGGVEWEAADQRVPGDLPRTIGFTGWHLAVGAQVQFRKPA